MEQSGMAVVRCTNCRTVYVHSSTYQVINRDNMGATTCTDDQINLM